jgi:hypothetical protein
VGDILKLVEPTVSPETVAVLTDLLQQAKAGQVVGVAFVAVHNLQDYTVDVAGVVRIRPTLIRGMVRALDDELGRLIGQK